MKKTESIRYRSSKTRTAILEYLRSTYNHPSAEEVHNIIKKDFPSTSFGTVYRNLNILVDQKEIARIESSRGQDLFDAQKPFHTHFRCQECGKVYDIPLDLKQTLHDLSQKTGHFITDHHIEFSGICSNCCSDVEIKTENTGNTT